MDLLRPVEEHQTANHAYFDEGERLLRLAQRAHDLWLAQPQTEKRKLLDLLLSNSTWDGENLDATYKKPFCWLAEGSLCTVWRG